MLLYRYSSCFAALWECWSAVLGKIASNLQTRQACQVAFSWRSRGQPCQMGTHRVCHEHVMLLRSPTALNDSPIQMSHSAGWIPAQGFMCSETAVPLETVTVCTGLLSLHHRRSASLCCVVLPATALNGCPGACERSG